MHRICIWRNVLEEWKKGEKKYQLCEQRVVLHLSQSEAQADGSKLFKLVPSKYLILKVYFFYPFSWLKQVSKSITRSLLFCHVVTYEIFSTNKVISYNRNYWTASRNHRGRSMWGTDLSCHPDLSGIASSVAYSMSTCHYSPIFSNDHL